MEKRARVTLVLSAAIAGVFAFWGGWTRRWMSDDGLIVLRTVRNILAGNGPVFNVGERVEANTSTLWQYLIAAFGWIPGVRLEDVAMWLALILTVVAVVAATLAAGRLWQRAWPGAGSAVLPFGVLIYTALPPARDFATSGLEWGLSLAWLATWFALLVAWSGSGNDTDRPRVLASLAFVSGLSWLVRPELALYGGLTGIVLLVVYWRDWGRIGVILGAALPVPAAYQIFRMGYYGLLTPHTAVAKSASDSEWATGARYVWDVVGTYALWAPLLVALLIFVPLCAKLRRRETLVIALVMVCALLHLLYVMRVGGDFMHGRMVLLPLFALLMPVAAVPATIVTGACAAVVAIWAAVVVYRGHDLGFEFHSVKPSDLAIVDEREFWTAATERESGNPPLYAEDFLAVDMMNGWDESLERAKRDDAAVLNLVVTSTDPNEFAWEPEPRTNADTDLNDMPTTLYMTNLGMTSMNAPLDVRVLDTVGLATPLGARQPRDPEGRVGHDKELPFDWQMADSPVDIEALDDDVDKQKVRTVRAALRSPEIHELLATSREPMSAQRFFKNIGYSLGKGRTLQLEDDASVYLDEKTFGRIANGEDVGLYGPRIFWPVDRLD